MQTIEVSNAVYKEIMSRRIGDEDVSQTIARELRPAPECAIRDELEQLRKEKGAPLPVVKKRLGL